MSSHQPIYDDLFGVYALIESECTENILLVKHQQGPYQGLYDFPGGTPEIQEILEQTLCRTVTKSIGLDIEYCKQHKAVSSLYEFSINEKPHVLRHIGVLYYASTSKNSPLLGESKISNHASWFKKSDILNRHVTPFVSLYLGK